MWVRRRRVYDVSELDFGGRESSSEGGDCEGSSCLPLPGRIRLDTDLIRHAEELTPEVPELPTTDIVLSSCFHYSLTPDCLQVYRTSGTRSVPTCYLLASIPNFNYTRHLKPGSLFQKRDLFF